VLIDSTHKRWFAVTTGIAVATTAFYLWCYRSTPGGLTGGSLVGLWYGLIGSALMVYAGLLSLLRRVPSWWWIGSRKVWLRGHIWLGLLSGLFIFYHSGFRWGGPLELVLWIVLLLTLATGIFGLLLQQFLPRILTTRIASEAPYEQIPHLCAGMRQRAETLVDAVRADDKIDADVRTELYTFFDREVRPFLAAAYVSSAELAHPLRSEILFAHVRAMPGMSAVKEQLGQLEFYCDERRQLGEQERLQRWLHGWLLLHVPLSVVLFVLGLTHAVVSLYY
jgi:vacuolar-type H+-ATPase subunit I/STV1